MNKYKWSILNKFKLNKKMSYKTLEEKNKAVAAQQAVVDSAEEENLADAKEKLAELKAEEVE